MPSDQWEAWDDAWQPMGDLGGGSHVTSSGESRVIHEDLKHGSDIRNGKAETGDFFGLLQGFLTLGTDPPH